MKLDIEEIIKIQKTLDEINKVELDEIEFYENGKKLNISKEYIKDWKYTGLDNKNFILTGCYKFGFTGMEDE